MERLNENKIICHIIGLNQDDKANLNKLCNATTKYNLIDLDVINNEILTSDEMTKMFKMYSSLKNNKNDKFKDVDKKMTKYWEDNMIKNVYDSITSKKKSILIGKNHHYRLLSKKVQFDVSNKFILDNNLKDEVKETIKHNLLNHHEEIINGTFPVQFLDYKFHLNKKKLFEESYTKIGYTKTNINEISNILKLHADNKIKGKGLWISLNEPYNIGSKIFPKNKPIYAYIDPVLSLINSFPIKDDEIDYSFKNKKVISINKGNVNKMKKARYLYMVSKEDFIPSDSTNKNKYFTQNPVLILEKEKISNVFNKLVDLKLLN